VKTAKLTILKASVIQVPHGADQINLTIAAPTAFPEEHWETTVKIEAAQGYGREWLKHVFGIELTAAHDRLAANPDMSVFERNLTEEPCGHCGTPIDLSTSPPKNRAGKVFCDNRCRRRSRE
jgi:hypothetical protein